MLSEMSFLFLLGLAGEGRAPRACAHVCLGSSRHFLICCAVRIAGGTCVSFFVLYSVRIALAVSVASPYEQVGAMGHESEKGGQQVLRGEHDS